MVWRQHPHRPTDTDFSPRCDLARPLVCGLVRCRRAEAGLSKIMLQLRSRPTDCSADVFLGYKHPLLMRLAGLPGTFASCQARQCALSGPLLAR